MKNINNILKNIYSAPDKNDGIVSYAKITMNPEYKAKLKAMKENPIKFVDLSEEEKRQVRLMASLADWEGGWGEEGKEDWDYGATAFKHGMMGLYAPIEFK